MGWGPLCKAHSHAHPSLPEPLLLGRTNELGTLLSETTSPGSFLTGSQRQEATSEWAQDSFPPGLPCSELGSLPTPALAQWFFPPGSILILTTTGFLQLVKKFLGLVPRYSNSLCFWGPGHEYSVNYLNTQLGKGSPTIPLTLPSSLTRLPNMCFVSWHK